jgi:SPASM domain peptide maturase of grasp-with-spasm system
MKTRYFKLYSYCVTTRGEEFSIVMDTQRIKCVHIPNFMHEILKEYTDHDVQKIEELYGDDGGIIMEYLTKLEKEQFGFFTEQPALYPALNINWSTPGKIHNAVIEIDNVSAFNYNDVLFQLEQLQCRHIELWLTENVNICDISGLLCTLNGSVIRSVDIIMAGSAALSPSVLLDLRSSSQKVNYVVVYNAPEEVVDAGNKIACTSATASLLKATHSLTDNYLCISLNFYLEALHFNPYYNKKVSIDKKGNIKNTLDADVVFGHVGNDRIGDIISSPGFQELWHVTGDRIVEQHTSPFRYFKMNIEPLEKVDDYFYRTKIS